MIVHANWFLARPLQAIHQSRASEVDNFLDTQHFPLRTMRGVLAYMRNLVELQKYAGVFPDESLSESLSYLEL